jgi:hypothetical protein
MQKVSKIDYNYSDFYKIVKLMKVTEIKLDIDWQRRFNNYGFILQIDDWDKIQHHDLGEHGLTDLDYIADLFYDKYLIDPVNAKKMIKEIFEDDLEFTEFDFDENPGLKGFLKESPCDLEKTLEHYIKERENNCIEFKSTLRWDINEETISRDRERDICKAIAGFLNTNGGTLLIGVSDDGSIYGIDKDIETLGRKDLDGFYQHLVQIIGNYLRIITNTYIDVEFDKINRKRVSILKIRPFIDQYF